MNLWTLWKFRRKWKYQHNRDITRNAAFAAVAAVRHKVVITTYAPFTSPESPLCCYRRDCSVRYRIPDRNEVRVRRSCFAFCLADSLNFIWFLLFEYWRKEDKNKICPPKYNLPHGVGQFEFTRQHVNMKNKRRAHVRAGTDSCLKNCITNFVQRQRCLPSIFEKEKSNEI